MSLARDSRQVKKLKAVRRAEFALRQKLERIDFEEDQLLPEVEALLAGKSVLNLPGGTVFDIVVQSEDPDQAKASDTGE